MILADTNVVSEFMRTEPTPSVLDWAAAIPPRGLCVSVITVQEIEFGLAQLPSGRRRRELEEKWVRVAGSFDDAIVAYDRAMAEATARVLVLAQTAGRAMELADAQIAGSCLANRWTLATRNVKDFEVLRDLVVINPFDG